jgi:isochorismate synthase EntC
MKEDMQNQEDQSDNSVLVKDYKNRNEKTFVTQKYSRYIIGVLLLYPNIDKIIKSLLPSICL